MTRQMALTATQELTRETLLWRVVIARTIQDWLSKPVGPKREAERYLFKNSVDLSLVCQSAWNRHRAIAHASKQGAGPYAGRRPGPYCMSHIAKSVRKKGTKECLASWYA